MLKTSHHFIHISQGGVLTVQYFSDLHRTKTNYLFHKHKNKNPKDKFRIKLLNCKV